MCNYFFHYLFLWSWSFVFLWAQTNHSFILRKQFQAHYVEFTTWLFVTKVEVSNSNTDICGKTSARTSRPASSGSTHQTKRFRIKTDLISRVTNHAWKFSLCRDFVSLTNTSFVMLKLSSTKTSLFLVIGKTSFCNVNQTTWFSDHKKCVLPCRRWNVGKTSRGLKLRKGAWRYHERQRRDLSSCSTFYGNESPKWILQFLKYMYVFIYVCLRGRFGQVASQEEAFWISKPGPSGLNEEFDLKAFLLSLLDYICSPLTGFLRDV